jgi:hypothetical protein
MPDLTIIVVSYNTRSIIGDCLQSIPPGAGDVRHEVIVVDNASPDGSAVLVAEHFPDVRLIRNAGNVGFAAANNQAIVESSGRYIVLLNADTVVKPAALQALVRFMDAHADVGYCGPQLINPDGTHQPSARRFPTVFSEALSLCGLHKRLPSSRHCLNLHEKYGSDEAFRTDWVTGACLVVRREVMEQVGLLDDSFFLYFEETDWCLRMSRQGWQGWYVPAGTVIHYGGFSLGPRGQSTPFYGNHPEYWMESWRLYMRKHHGPLAAWVARMQTLGLHAVLWLKHRGRSNHASAIKARRAASAIQYLLGRAPKQQQSSV